MPVRRVTSMGFLRNSQECGGGNFLEKFFVLVPIKKLLGFILSGFRLCTEMIETGSGWLISMSVKRM